MGLNVPLEIQVELVGAVALLLAAGVTAWVALKQYRLQRALEVKKEVLLESVRGAFGAAASLGAFSDVERSLPEISAHFTGCLTKLTVAGAVADVSTVKAGTALLNALGPAYLKLLVARTPVESLHDEFLRVEAMRERQHSDNVRYFGMQEQAMAAGDSGKFNNVQVMFAAGTKAHADLVRERDDLNEKLLPMRKQLVVHMIDAQTAIQPLIRKYVACVRRDIGVGGSEADYLDAAFVDPSVARKAMNDAIEAIEKPA